MDKVTINGKNYPINVDGFGVITIFGKLVDDFIESLPDDDIMWLVNRGVMVVQNEPEKFDDIAERIEMPRETKTILDSFKNPQKGVEE